MAVFLRKAWLDEELNKVDLENIRASVQKSETTGDFLLYKIMTREQQMLTQIFGTSITPEEFLVNYENLRTKYAGLDKLTTEGIRLSVLKYAAQTGNEAALDEVLVHNMIAADLEEAMKDPKFNGNIAMAAAEIVKTKADEGFEAATKNSTVNQRHVKVYAKAYTSLGSNATLEQVLSVTLADLGYRTAERLTALARTNANMEAKRPPKVKGNKKDRQNFNVEIDVPLEWFKYTEGRSAKEVKEMQGGKKLVTSANAAFKADLIQYVGSDIPYLSEIIDYLLKKQPEALFVGANSDAMAGFLGELRAMCFMALLMGNKFALNAKTLAWAAQNRQSGVGHQSHADITVFKEFGIQVKNTIKSITDTVQFRNLKFDAFLDTLVNNGLISDEQKQQLLTIFEAYYFNKPYWYSQMIHDNNKHKPEGQKEKYAISVASNPDFADTRARIDMLKYTAQQIISSLITELFYIGTGNAAKDEHGNIMFFVDNRLLFASTVIQAIQEEVNKMQNNLDSICNVLYNGGPTIITAINDNNIGIISRESSGPKFNDSVINALQLKSAWDFSAKSPLK